MKDPITGTGEFTTHITLVLDRSGSMHTHVDDMIGGVNKFVEEQKAVGDNALMTCVLFDHEYKTLFAGKSLDDVPVFTAQNYVPRGRTALLDAVNRAVAETAERVKPEDRVIVMVVTDGRENDSREVTKDQLAKIIQEHESRNWVFTYLSASPSAFSDARQYGFDGSNTIHTNEAKGGMTDALRATSHATTSYRTNPEKLSKGLMSDAPEAMKKDETS